jgi:hypothetical protein
MVFALVGRAQRIKTTLPSLQIDINGNQQLASMRKRQIALKDAAPRRQLATASSHRILPTSPSRKSEIKVADQNLIFD